MLFVFLFFNAAAPPAPAANLFRCLSALAQLVSELATQTAEGEQLDSQQREVAERFGFFQRTRNALSDLCGMLREKVWCGVWIVGLDVCMLEEASSLSFFIVVVLWLLVFCW